MNQRGHPIGANNRAARKTAQSIMSSRNADVRDAFFDASGADLRPY
jgi:hypothetical protein